MGAVTTDTFITAADPAKARARLGLDNVDNTRDVDKPVSGPQETALQGKQDADSDLTAIATMTPANDDLIQRKAGAWTHRTPAQVKADLALAKADVGLGNVDNTSDLNKPVSTAQQAAINTAVSNLLNGAPGALDTLKELADALGDDANFAASVTAALAGKAPNLTPTAVKTTAYTAAAGDLVIVDTTTAAVPVTLPTAPPNFTRIGGKVVLGSVLNGQLVNAATFTCGGSDVINKTGGSTSVTVSMLNQAITLLYYAGIWYVISDDIPMAGLDTRYQRIKDLKRPANNTVVCLGSSVDTWATGDSSYLPGCFDNFMGHLSMLSFQRIRYGGVIGHGGYTQQQIIDNYLPTVLAMNPAPGACIYADTPFNDLNTAAGNLTFAQTKANFLKVINALLDKGIVPILGTVPSQNYGTQYAAMAQWNRYVRRFAATNGFPLIDINTAVYDLNGAIFSGYSQDQVHFKSNGHRLVAEQAIADGLLEWFNPCGSVQTSRYLGDLENLLNNGTVNIGLFNADANADGVADGWTVNQGLASKCSLVTPTAQDQLAGKWQQAALVTGDTPIWLAKTLTTGFSAGDVLKVAARVQTENIETTGAAWTVTLHQYFAGGYNYPAPGSGAANPAGYVPGGCPAWTSEMEDGLLRTEVPVLAGSTSVFASIQFSPGAAAGTAKLRVGEFTIINLTTGNYLT